MAYRIARKIRYAGNTAEPGDIVSDLPKKSIKWLVEAGHIEKVDDDAPSPKDMKASDLLDAVDRGDIDAEEALESEQKRQTPRKTVVDALTDGEE